jgi:hypothetical protein
MNPCPRMEKPFVAPHIDMSAVKIKQEQPAPGSG